MNLDDYVVKDSQWIVVHTGELSNAPPAGTIVNCDGVWSYEGSGDGRHIAIDFECSTRFTYFPVDKFFTIILPVSMFDKRDMFKAKLSGKIDHIEYQPMVYHMEDMARSHLKMAHQNGKFK